MWPAARAARAQVDGGPPLLREPVPGAGARTSKRSCRPRDPPSLPTVQPQREEFMNDHVVMIEDTRGVRFLMEIWTPSTATNLKFWHCDRTRYQIGDWEAIHKGFIRYTSGDAFLTPRNYSPVIPSYCFSGAVQNLADLYLGGPDSADAHDLDTPFEWGMVLYNFVSEYGRTTGSGVVKQNWVLALKPGEILWRQPTQQDFFDIAAQGLVHS
jgi:hypothetical protein